MRIKKHKNNNEYLLTKDNVWVRNLCKPSVPCFDINNLFSEDDFKLMLNNEIENMHNCNVKLDGETIKGGGNAVIVSDGFLFDKKQELLGDLPPDTTIFAINGALKKWKLMEKDSPIKRRINYFIVNNPYKECIGLLPLSNKYYPKCIASVRTYPEFIKKYKGYVYLYASAINKSFEGSNHFFEYRFDDYRNPICAALSVVSRFNFNKVLLFCCDNSFAEERQGSVQLENGMWTYPQHLKSHEIIDSMLFWIKNNSEIEVKNHSFSPNYLHASYINEEIRCFFEARSDE